MKWKSQKYYTDLKNNLNSTGKDETVFVIVLNLIVYHNHEIGDEFLLWKTSDNEKSATAVENTSKM